MPRMDRRVERTRRSLRDAFFALAREQPLESISVSDIADRAGINRSTYYQHYSDKDTLLADALDAVIDDALGQTDDPIDDTEGERIFRIYLRHVQEHAALYRVLLGEAGSAAIQVRMAHRLETLLLQVFQRESMPISLAALPPQVAAAALAGSAVATVRAWLDIEPLPPADVATSWIFTVLLNHGPLENERSRPAEYER